MASPGTAPLQDNAEKGMQSLVLRKALDFWQNPAGGDRPRDSCPSSPDPALPPLPLLPAVTKGRIFHLQPSLQHSWKTIYITFKFTFLLSF